MALDAACCKLRNSPDGTRGSGEQGLNSLQRCDEVVLLAAAAHP
jgi:hypothetical protein